MERSNDDSQKDTLSLRRIEEILHGPIIDRNMERIAEDIRAIAKYASADEEDVNARQNESNFIRILTIFVVIYVENRVLGIDNLSHRKGVHRWFGELFDAIVWRRVPARYFVRRILNVLCVDSLYDESNIEDNDRRFTMRLSIVCFDKFSKSIDFGTREKASLRRCFEFYARYENVFMLLPLSLFVPFELLNNVYQAIMSSLLIFQENYNVWDVKKLDVLSLIAFYRDLKFIYATRELEKSLRDIHQTFRLFDDRSTLERDVTSLSFQSTKITFQRFALLVFDTRVELSRVEGFRDTIDKLVVALKNYYLTYVLYDVS